VDSQHPWTNYEVARLRNEERLLRARDAMRALEVREASPEDQPTADRTRRRGSLLGRVLRHGAPAARAKARTEAS
jgi:hypothetical protein